MFNAAQLLDASVSAVMIRYEKSFSGDDFSCASSSELNDGILQGAAVYIVDLLGGQFAPQFFHCIGIHFLKQGKKPHAFVCHRAETYGQSRDDAKDSFHI
jgi:hypothetical protein